MKRRIHFPPLQIEVGTTLQRGCWRLGRDCVYVSLFVCRHLQKFRGQLAPAEMVLQALRDNRFIDSGGEGIRHESE